MKGLFIREMKHENLTTSVSDMEIPQIKLQGNRILLNGKVTNFIIQELVPESIFKKYGGQSIRFINPISVNFLQFTREWFDSPMTINNWHKGGRFHNRGFREPLSGLFGHIERTKGKSEKEQTEELMKALGFDTYIMTFGSWISVHKLGLGFDWNIAGQTANETRKELMDNQNTFVKQGLTTLEDERFAPTWVHGDGRPTGLDHFLIVKPK